MTEKEFDEKFTRCTSHGWLDRDEAILLVNSAEKTNGPLVEVGSYQGRSAMLLGQLGRVLYCIDTWDDYFHSTLPGEEIYAMFLQHIKEIPNSTIIPIRTSIDDWQPDENTTYEFFYLDGDHTYEGTILQIRKALSCNPKVIAMHDVNDSGGGVNVTRAALDFLGTWNERVSRLAIWNRR